MIASHVVRRERDWSLSHRRLAQYSLPVIAQLSKLREAAQSRRHLFDALSLPQ
jgi:hypothetical protein